MLQENQDPVQECPAKRPRHLESVVQSPAAKAHAAPDTAHAAADAAKKKQEEKAAEADAAPHGSLSQETLRMGACSPEPEDTDIAE